MVVFDLKSGSSTKVTDSGTWMYTNGHDISWAAVSGHVGYYDPMAREVHLIDTRGAETVDAYVMGSYFVWQEFRTSSADATQVGPRTSAFYALRLGE